MLYIFGVLSDKTRNLPVPKGTVQETNSFIYTKYICMKLRIYAVYMGQNSRVLRKGVIFMNKHMRISFRIDENEVKIIEKAEKNFKNRSEFFRSLLQNFLPVSEQKNIQIELEKLRMEIHKIGINVNQITKNNNSELYFQSDKKNLGKNLERIIELETNIEKILRDL